MSPRRELVLLALLVLSGCLDPLVGTECATGYSPCHGVCVASGTCVVSDAGAIATEAGVGVDASLDMDDGEAGENVDSNVGETGSEAGPSPDLPAVDEAAPDAPEGADVPLEDDVSPADEDDVGVAPIFADDGPLDESQANDAERSEDGLPCAECLDAEGAEDTNGQDGEITIDGASDGAVSAEDTNAEDANADANGEDAMDSPALDSALVCADPQVNCDEQCVDTTSDPENCGACSNICETGVCLDGDCLVCATDESVCGQVCKNLAIDPDNCGACGNPCMSGLCSNGLCEAAGTGRAIALGHDYLRNRPAMNRILGNAVFLWPVNPVRLLVYEGDANTAAVAGADAAIAQVASATGRQWLRIPATAGEVSTQLATASVFLIYSQELALDSTLIQLGSDWAAALDTFVHAGGTVISLDGEYASNSGTSQILAQAGLFQIARGSSVTGDVCTVVARGDALATGLPRTYLCEQNSTSFVVTDSATTITPVVEDLGLAVVVHKIF